VPENEVLAKFIRHNLCVGIQEVRESGIDPTSGAKQRGIAFVVHFGPSVWRGQFMRG
jgi:hypothetical protein